MKRFLTLLTIAMTCLTLFATTAEAGKRLGGGGSVGKQRSTAPQQAQQAPAATPSPMQNATPAKQGNKWLGPLAGIAAGLGLAALFSHFGLGEGMGMLLMIVAAVVAVLFLVSMLRKKQQPSFQYAAATPTGGSVPSQPSSSQPFSGASAAATPAPVASNIPADFPVDSFLRSAKTSFIRLQAANDRKDLNDIREYTTPEMYAEISMQLQERDDAPQKTDVQAINASLLEVANEGDYAIASVRFTGQLRENNGTPESIDEIWHVQKDLRDDKSVWLLAGIQQTTLQ